MILKITKKGIIYDVLIDDDIVLPYETWCLDHIGYVRHSLTGGGVVFLHRWIMNAPKGKVVDHINHNKLDNRRCNLRLCNRRQNMWNRKPNKNGTSKYKGVSWYKKSNKWRATISINGTKKTIGYYNNEYDAHLAYEKIAKELHKDFKFNYPI